MAHSPPSRSRPSPPQLHTRATPCMRRIPVPASSSRLRRCRQNRSPAEAGRGAVGGARAFGWATSECSWGVDGRGNAGSGQAEDVAQVHAESPLRHVELPRLRGRWRTAADRRLGVGGGRRCSQHTGRRDADSRLPAVPTRTPGADALFSRPPDPESARVHRGSPDRAALPAALRLGRIPGAKP